MKRLRFILWLILALDIGFGAGYAFDRWNRAILIQCGEHMGEVL